MSIDRSDTPWLSSMVCVRAFQNLEFFNRDNDALRCDDIDHGEGVRSKSGVRKVRDHSFDLSRAGECLRQVIASRQKYICNMESNCVAFMYQIPSRRFTDRCARRIVLCTKLPKMTTSPPGGICFARNAAQAISLE